MLRTVFLGTPELALPALRVLHDLTDLRLVITQPDRPAGRGRRPAAPAVKVAAEALGLSVWQPERLDEADGPSRMAVDLAVVMAYGQILRQPALDAPRLGCVNLHASLLPRWRGASPLQAAIRAGDRRSGISVMHMVRRLDAGPVYHCRGLDLPVDVTLSWLHDHLAGLAGECLRYFLVQHATLVARPQVEDQVTVCCKLGHQDGCIDWHQSARDLDRLIRAYVPVPGCWAPSRDGELRIHAATIACDQGDLPVAATQVHHHRLLVGCGEGVLEITRLQAPGGRMLATGDYLNGHPVPVFTAS